METDLPFDLRMGLDRLLQGISRRALAQHADSISHAYRSGRSSSETIQSVDDALAYALVRLPATFAAATAVFAALKEASPNLAPRTLSDIGAGPGTATWAAISCFPALTNICLIDENEHFRLLALELFASSTVPALRDADYRRGSALHLLRTMEPADLTIANYFVGELPDTQLLSGVDLLWSRTIETLVIIEPGTPAGFRRVREVRSHLIDRNGHVVCPCPHDLECPLTGDDWCHFSQRLNRSRDHRQVKGTALPFEDEKFSYVALVRHRPTTTTRDRVLARPRLAKNLITTKLCTAEGLMREVVSRRDRDEYRRRRSWRWGDAVTRSAEPASGSRDSDGLDRV
jgi:ribosomal protein RSM22 (predicted rRNA methylase)